MAVSHARVVVTVATIVSANLVSEADVITRGLGKKGPVMLVPGFQGQMRLPARDPDEFVSLIFSTEEEGVLIRLRVNNYTSAAIPVAVNITKEGDIILTAERLTAEMIAEETVERIIKRLGLVPTMRAAQEG